MRQRWGGLKAAPSFVPQGDNRVEPRGLVRRPDAEEQSHANQNWRVLGFTAAVAVLICFFFGLTQAIRATRIADAAKSLQEAGVRFERYPGMEQDELGIWTAPGGAKVAW